jgi:hypothetical protein
MSSKLTYSQNCRCGEPGCRCNFFCRSIDNGLCDFCVNGWHAYFDHIYYNSDCSMCGMPSYMERAFPKCHGMTEQQAHEWSVETLCAARVKAEVAPNDIVRVEVRASGVRYRLNGETLYDSDSFWFTNLARRLYRHARNAGWLGLFERYENAF